MFIAATAASTAAFAIRTPSCQVLSLSEVDKNTRFFDRYLKWVSPRPRLSEAKTKTVIQGPTRLPAQWLSTVQERIQRSILPRNQENDGRWLTEGIALSSSTFFETASDLLPGEPYIYTSSRGDLVAEFQSDSGVMTGIITPEFVGLFAVIDGVSVEKTLPLANPANSTRQGLQEFTETLRTEQHGALGTRS